MTGFPKTVKEHHQNVRALRCCITGNPAVTLHHCHSGSMSEAGYHSAGGKRGCGEALVLPIKAEFHCIGENAIDGEVGVLTWEKYFGTQMEHLADISEQLGYDVFTLHKRWANG